MATETQTAPKAAEPGKMLRNSPGAVAGTVDSQNMSMEALASQLAGKKKQATAGTGPGTSNEGQVQGNEPADDSANGNGTPEEQAAAAAEAARLASLTPEEREAEESEAARLAALTPEEREAETAEAERRAALSPEELAAEDAAAAGEQDGGEEPLELEQVPRLSPEQKRHVGELFRQRIGKVIAKTKGEAEAAVAEATAARETAEREKQELQTQLENARANQPAQAPAGNEPLANVTSPEQLQKAITDAQSVKTWAKQHLIRLHRNPDAVGAALKAAGIQLQDESPEGMEEWLSEAEMRADQTLTVDAPKRAEFLKQEKTFSENAERAFPFLKDPKSEGYTNAMRVLSALPEMKRLPHWKVAAGLYALGLETFNRQQAAAKPNGTAGSVLKAKPPTKVITRPATAARAIAPKAAEAQAARTKFAETGTVEALTNMFKSQRP